MADNLKGIPFNTPLEGIDFPSIAKDLVRLQAENLGVFNEYPDAEIYLVWFAFTLGNWKALCSTSAPDGRYYEVTYKVKAEGGGGVAFIDTYRKTHNIEVEVFLGEGEEVS